MSQPAAAKPRSRTRQVVQVVSIVLVVAIFWLMLRGIDLGQVWAEILSDEASLGALIVAVVTLMICERK
jgi:hypothetical protein